jgi:hypothetical protein
METETGIVLPPGVSAPPGAEEMPDRVIIDNRTPLPDQDIQEAVRDMFVENASLAGVERSTFQTYAAEGSMLARRRYQTPANVIDEIKLARSLAERDDDVAAVLGETIAIAFGEGFEHQGDDEATVELFTEMAKAKYMNLSHALQEMYRELLISSQVNTAILFTRETINYTLQGSDRRLSKSVAAPLIGVLHAENIRVIGNDMFGTGQLAYYPEQDRLRRWLEKYFNPRTEPAVKAQMGREDRVSANMFTGKVPQGLIEAESSNWGERWSADNLYFLNPKMVHRSTFPKGQWKYPRPLLTRDFSLLEAKRLLNIMDYALLQGGSNFIVVAKKGSDKRPAQKEEIENLQNVVRTASKTGVIVGDHRLEFEVITPKMEALLAPEKRRLLGRKIVQGMLRIPEAAQEQPARSSTANPELESKARVITSDRKILKAHAEDYIYDEIENRNPNVFKKGTPCIAFPKIILQGTQFFTDYMLKLRDRGDIPRKWAVEFAGFDFDAAVDQRKREIESGADEVLKPAEVPFSSPNSGPQDNQPGRPPGSPDKPPGSPPGLPAPKTFTHQNPGETIHSWYEEELDAVCRMGEVTYAVLDQYPKRAIGRMTETERRVLEDGGTEAVQKGSSLYVPVNPTYAVKDPKAIRLEGGLSLVIGQREGDGAFVAKLVCFRETEFTALEAEELTLRWGFPIKLPEAPPELPSPPAE